MDITLPRGSFSSSEYFAPHLQYGLEQAYNPCMPRTNICNLTGNRISSFLLAREAITSSASTDFSVFPNISSFNIE